MHLSTLTGEAWLDVQSSRARGRSVSTPLVLTTRPGFQFRRECIRLGLSAVCVVVCVCVWVCVCGCVCVDRGGVKVEGGSPARCNSEAQSPPARIWPRLIRGAVEGVCLTFGLHQPGLMMKDKVLFLLPPPTRQHRLYDTHLHTHTLSLSYNTHLFKRSTATPQRLASKYD